MRTSGRSGAGHFTKMVHNGIEYGLYAGLRRGLRQLMQNPSSVSTCTRSLAIWRYGSVVRSWLLEPAYAVFEKEGSEPGEDPRVRRGLR